MSNPLTIKAKLIQSTKKLHICDACYDTINKCPITVDNHRLVFTNKTIDSINNCGICSKSNPITIHGEYRTRYLIHHVVEVIPLS